MQLLLELVNIFQRLYFQALDRGTESAFIAYPLILGNDKGLAASVACGFFMVCQE